MGKSSISAFELQHAIAAIGLDQREFAELFHVNQSSVSRWLNGKVPVPGYVEAWLLEAHPEVFGPNLEAGSE